MQSVYNESEHVIVGPGAEEGLSWLYEDMGSLSSVDGVHHLMKIQHEYFDKLGVTDQQLVQLFGEYPRPPSHAGQPRAAAAQGQRFQALNLMDVENCLCEGNKYFRVRFQDGSGDPKTTLLFFPWLCRLDGVLSVQAASSRNTRREAGRTKPTVLTTP